MTDEMTHLYLAENATKSGPGGGVDDEDITTHLVPFVELSEFFKKSAQNGVLIDFKIHAALAAVELR